MVSFSIRPSGGGPLATTRAGSALGMTLPTLRKYGIAASYRKVGAALPYDAEVEYLQSTGTQYIDTGVYLNGALAIELSFRPLNTNVRPCGAADTRKSPTWNQWAIVGSDSVLSNISIGSNQNLSVEVAGAVGRDLTMRAEGRLLVVNGVSNTKTTWTLPGEDTNVTLGLFGCHVARPNNVVDWAVLANMRLYSARILDGDSVVRDMIPVRFTNEQGQSEGAMYDKRGVGGMNPDGSARNDGLYRNQGTGAFSWGNDVAVVPQSETVQCVVPGKWSLDTPSFTNRRLIGWFTTPNDPFDESGDPPAGALEIVNGSAMDLPLPETVYACWQHKATITFDPNLQGASVDMVPELYVGDPLTNVNSAYVIMPSGSGALQVGWSANVAHAPSRRLIDVDPDSVQGGINYNTQGAVASGDVYYALLLLPARVTLDLNASSVDSSFDPSLDGTPGDYYENNLYFYIPEASDPMRDDVRFAFWTRDAHPAASYDPWQSMVTQIDPNMDKPTDGETLYAVWQNAVPVRFLECTDPIVYVFDGENLPDQLPEPDPGYGPQGATFDGWEDSYQTMDVHEGDPVYSSYIGNNPSYPDDWTLTPKWAYAVSVTFDATTNGGSMPSGWVPPEYYSGRPYGTLPTPTHPTLSFAGWYDGQTRVTTSSIVPAGGANLVAQYAAQSYSVDLNGEWRVVDPMDVDASGETTPTDLAGCDHFESVSNYGVRPEAQTYDPNTGSYVYTYNKSECASMTISVVGYNEFTIYVRASPSAYEYEDYIAVVLADNGIPQQPESDEDYWNGTMRIVQYSPPDDPYGNSYDVSDNPWYYINYSQWSAMAQETFHSQYGYDSTRQAGVDTWPWVKNGLPSEDPPLDGSGVVAMTYDMICQERLDQDYMGDVSQLDEYIARPPQGTIDGYIPVTVQLTDAGQHDIVVMYRKGVDDWNGDPYLSQYGTKDRGFVIIPPGGQPL